MHNHGTSISGVADLHPAHKHEEGSRVVRHAVVRPGSELVLPHFTLLWAAVLQHIKTNSLQVCIRMVQLLWGDPSGKYGEWIKGMEDVGERVLNP